jgi:hypothetical protein
MRHYALALPRLRILVWALAADGHSIFPASAPELREKDEQTRSYPECVFWRAAGKF